MKATSATLFVCPTTHIDWDWLTDFEQYYATGLTGPDLGPSNAVSYTFDQMFQQLEANPRFVFNLAEMGYLHRYFQDQNRTPDIIQAGPRLALMGGGITSPDSLLSHGEAFIRNYLLGTQWLSSLGLLGARAPLAWLPDDFGHDPQLPVVLAAMGMTAVAFSRVPGSPQPSPFVQRLSDQGNTAKDLANGRLVFPWVSADGSQVLAHFMPATYAVAYDAARLDGFVQASPTNQWGGGTNMFVPVPGGDFATPPADILDQIDDYNSDYAGQNAVIARAGTFADFVTAVLATAYNLPPAFTLQASNYWCGQFASRPQLKLDHGAAVSDLLATEVVISLLLARSTLSRSTLDALNNAIESVWWSVAASTHHDFITGTASDQTYQLEQLPLSTQTCSLARGAYSCALSLLGKSVTPTSDSSLDYLVFNPLGFARGGLVELTGVGASIGGTVGGVPVQVSADGGLLIFAPNVPSFGYATVSLTTGDDIPSDIPPLGETVVWANGLVEVTLSERAGWTITSLVDVASGEDVVLSSGSVGALWVYQDDGNLYQFGNEPLCNNTTGTFAPTRRIDTVESAALTENGPLRWRLEVTLVDATSEKRYAVTTSLQLGEPFVRITVTGCAPDSNSSVVVVSQFAAPDGASPDGVAHGTACHWTDVLPDRYWYGPTFLATHDYLLPTANGQAIAAVFHAGMPAWCLDQGDKDGNGGGSILGVALRSASGTQRGAAGTDPDTHTQQFAFGVPGAAGLDPATCVPLQTGLGFSTGLAAVALGSTPPTPGGMPATLSLASVSSGNGLLRAARPQKGSAGISLAANDPTGSPFGMVLRAYAPQNSSGTTLEIDLPAFQTPPTPRLVTALELPIQADGLPQAGSTVAPSGGGISVTMGSALCSIQLVGRRPFVSGSKGTSL